jgi:hypothetical protein
MITWKEACAQANYDPQAPAPEVTKRYIGYKQGEVQYFDTEAAAKQFSNLIEVDPACTKQRDEFRAAQKRRENKAMTIWYTALSVEHCEISSAVFDLCYSEAYDRGHYAGYDEVANYMSSVVEFAKKVIEASNDDL